MFELSFIWAGIIAFSVLSYVVLDGFDLGVGILFPLADDEREKATMMNSIALIWDGNETWLVLGGGGLFAVFPLAYAVIMPALYMPIILMLLALIFRGVAFEYRWRTQRRKPVWNVAFFGGSIVAAFMQGIALGALVQGIEFADRANAGGWWDWLIMKTEGSLQRRMQSHAWWLAASTLGFIGIVSILTPFQDPEYFQRWLNLPGSIFSVLMPGAVLAAAWTLFTGQNAGRDAQPFFAAQSIFVLCFIGIGISFYPNIVPPSLTIVEAAAPDESLRFTLYGTAVLVPMILAYTAYAYWVFRGKINPDEGYH